MQLFTLIIGFSLFVIIIELVRRRKMREEYSLLWLLSGAVICILSLWYDALAWITRLVGAVYPPSTLFFFGLIFLAVINIFYSVKLSKLSGELKNLAQKIALLEIGNKNTDVSR